MYETREFLGGINGVPQFRDRKAMWDSLTVEVVTKRTQAIEVYVSHLARFYRSGRVEHGCFELGDSEVLDWYVSRNQLQEMLFFRHIWKKKPIHDFFDLGDIHEDSHQHFGWSSPFMLGGSLAWVLDSGGPYERPSWGGRRSKDLGEYAANALIEGDYADTLVFESKTAWCSFFLDVAWDYTWIVLRKKTRLLHVLMATDTD